MTMAHDSGPMPPNAIAERTVESVRTAIERYLREESEATPALGSALHTLACEARDKSVPPEQLLIILKAIWYGLPEVQSLDAEAQQMRSLQRVVTMCIKEYFAK